jgi:hypothetical protein
MIRIVPNTLTELPGPVRDIDVASDGAWVAACDSDAGPVVCTPDTQFANPLTDSGAIVRLLRNRDIVVISPRAQSGHENAAIVSQTGEVRSRFSVGDGVEDAIVLGEHIVCSYFDEGALWGGLGAEGICVFGEAGKLVLGYHSDVAGAIQISDCYCMAPVGIDEVCFSAYTEFPIVVFNVRTGSQRVYELPESLAGCAALSSGDAGYYMHGPYSARSDIVYWTPGSDPVRVGAHEGKLRGMRGGTFLTTTPVGYAMLRASSA